MFEHKEKRKSLILSISAVALILIGSLIFFISSKSETKADAIIPSSVPKTVDTKKEQIDQPTKQNALTLPNVEISSLNIPILMYHHIRDYTDPSDPIGVGLSVSTVKFTSQLDKIKDKGFHTITFNDIENGDIPSKPIILSFDDGYENFYQNAFPALKQRGMTAISYVISGKKDSNYMTENQIREISDAGIEIGDHTISHPDLSTLTEQKQRTEIFQSRDNLEKIIGKKIISFCFPSGKYNETTLALIKEAGFVFATTTKPGQAHFDKLFELQRYRMNHDTNIDLYLK